MRLNSTGLIGPNLQHLDPPRPNSRTTFLKIRKKNLKSSPLSAKHPERCDALRCNRSFQVFDKTKWTCDHPPPFQRRRGLGAESCPNTSNCTRQQKSPTGFKPVLCSHHKALRYSVVVQFSVVCNVVMSSSLRLLLLLQRQHYAVM